MTDQTADNSIAGSPSPGLWTRVKNLFGMSRPEQSLKESFEDVLEEHEELAGALTPEERLMLTNIVSLREARVEDVMVPRADIVMVDATASLDDCLTLFEEAAHSRMPIFRGTADDVIGMIHIKDLLRWWSPDGDIGTYGATTEPFDAAQVARRVLFVPPSMPVMDLLQKMQATRIHMALVIDEYGGTDGLVTIEDLIEEIVGEIEDEHDSDDGPLIRERDNGVYAVNARAEISDLEDILGVELNDDEDIDTVGGLVFALAGQVPQRGEVVRHKAGFEFTVKEADPRRIKNLTVTKLRRKPAKSNPND